ncbi:uncharacterized protein LOC141691804 [Apium graveolens]|uniref:uncharacterized protein LOC141691804 n=1 Tax=Apium graveolens TaxID=4045 RepID=UPI003D7ABE0F
MQATLGGSPSFVWRSILEARKVISDGACWRIGNGTNIQIMDQPWLNAENSHVTTVSPALENQMVASLFRSHTREWELDTIREVFNDQDQQHILNTMIEQDLEEDVLNWKFENSGNYSVKLATTCWKIFDPGIHIGDNEEFHTWLERNLTRKSDNIKAKVVTLCWSIWRSRNDLVWNKKIWQPMFIVAKTWEYLSQWKTAQNCFSVAPMSPPTAGDGAIIWAKPDLNEVKITTDATIFAEKGFSGMGIIARNHEGYLITAKSSTRPEVMQPVLGEALAIKEALSWAKEIHSHIVTVETDCLVAVQLIRSAVPMRSRMGKIIQDCREIIREVNNIKLYFIKRSANMAAHELALVSHMYPDCNFNWTSVPSMLRIVSEMSL